VTYVAPTGFNTFGHTRVYGPLSRYLDALPNATWYAKFQGYDGARWPKATGRPNPRYSNTLPPTELSNGARQRQYHVCSLCTRRRQRVMLLPTSMRCLDLHPTRQDRCLLGSIGTAVYWDWPGPISTILIWEQPHMVWVPELEYTSCATNHTRIACQSDVVARMKE
jgi:hypothetical protein